ncbi:hypothetical protein PQX77_012987 [Marasmius sp. AFHP31]|nr:hypothetical protein PQX77_012987 [Marasmius sp. AFHP31]
MVLNIDDDGLLAVELDVPSVAYAVYTSTSTSAIQLARSTLLQRDAENDLQSSFISTVQVTTAAASLYIFRLPRATDDLESTLNMLNNIPIDGAQLKEGPTIMNPGYLYPSSTSFSPPPLPTSSASRLPRRSWRDVWAKFLDACRERIIADIVKRSASTGRTLNRLKDGFLLGQVSSKLSGTMNEWAAGWESRVKTRSLIYTHIHIHLSGETLIIHPTLSPTPFIPLTNLISKSAGSGGSLQQGIPITLLPYATPAHYLSTYSGPTSALTKQFREVLQGCGTAPLDIKSTYIIAWIPVENAHGEEKGLTVIYPAELCVGYIPAPGTIPLHSLAFRSAQQPMTSTTTPTSAAPPSTSTSFTHTFSTAGPWTPFGRTLLPTIPSLPAPLQPSPTVLHVLPPGSIPSHPHPTISAPSPGGALFGRDTLFTGVSYMPTPPTSSAVGTVFPPATPSTYSALHVQPGTSVVPTSPFTSTHPPPASQLIPTSYTPLYASPSSLLPTRKHAYALSRAVSYSFKEAQQRQREVTYIAATSPAPPSSCIDLPSRPDIRMLLKSAQGIGGYIDAVAKDREKERERLRLGGTKVPTNDQSQAQSSKPQVPILNQQPAPYPSVAPYPHTAPSLPSPQPPQMQQQQQSFYPSPPGPPSAHGILPSSAPLSAQLADMKKEEEDAIVNGDGQVPLIAEVPNSDENDAKDEEMLDDEDLFGASPPAIMEDLPVEPTTDPPDPVPPPPPVPPPGPVPQKEKAEASDSLWGDMDRDIMGGWGFDMGEMDITSGNLSANLGMEVDMFGFEMSSSSGSVPPPPRSSVQSSSASSAQAMSSAATASRPMQSVSKSMSFEEDITDDDFNWFDTHDSNGGPSNFMDMSAGTTPGAGAGSLDAGATLFSSIPSSHPSVNSIQSTVMTHSGTDPFTATSVHGGMHPPPVPHHAFGMTPSSSAGSPWMHSPHRSTTMGTGTPNTPGIPPDMFPLSPPEEGSTMGLGTSIGTPMAAATPQTPTPTPDASARWGAGWGVQLESPFSSPERKHASIPVGRTDGDGEDTEEKRRLSVFDPIPFAASHRVADGKYVYGKFMMPSPPLDGDIEDGPGYFSCTPKGKEESSTRTGLTPYLKGLRLQYNTKTDPRIGTVKQLKVIGVKRKRKTSDNEFVSRIVTPPWVKMWEADWKETRPLRKDAGPLSPAPSSPASEDGSDDEQDSDDEDGLNRTGSSTPISDFCRPTTPLPHYVPMGPSLLSTQFHHAHLLPLSSPLRSRDGSEDTHMSGVGGGGLGAAAASVPTPVSPGATSDQSKNLEAAAEMVAREVVENDVWGLAWRMNSCFGKGINGSKPAATPGMTLDALAGVGLGSEMGQSDVSAADVKLVKELIRSVGGLRGPFSLAQLFENDIPKGRSVVPLDPPLVSVGKGNTVIDVMPTALRFWEKLGLGPKHGEKNATAYVLFEDHGEWRQHQVELWLSNLISLYRVKNLGDMIAGTGDHCEKDGLVPLRFDSSFRKNLASFVASLPTGQTSFVFFVIVPTVAMTLSSPTLRQVLPAVKKAIKTYSEAQILFQFIPEEVLIGNMDPSSPDDMGTSRLCSSMYNRILRPVERVMSRRFFEHGMRVRNYFQEPAVTLSRPARDTKVTYVNNAHTSLGVIDRHTLLHIGYQVSHCKKWLLAACVDQRGEAHDVGVWLLQPPDSERDEPTSEEMDVVSKVWEFAAQFADKVDVEWRIVIAKLGLLDAAELDAWNAHLITSLHANRRRTPLHVSVVAVQTSSPWVILPSRPKLTSTTSVPGLPAKPPPLNRSVTLPPKPSVKTGSAQLFIDSTTTTYALFYKSPLTSTSPPTLESLGITCTIVVDDPASRGEEQPQMSFLLPLRSATLVRLPSSPHTSVSAPSFSTSSRMLDIHLISSAAPTPSSSDSMSVEALSPKAMYQPLLRDIVHSYHMLSVLSSSRMQLTGVNDLLPFHLGAVEAMRNALSLGKGSTDVYD